MEAYWIVVYRLIMNMIIPFICILVINIAIIRHVRFSSHRVQPQSQTDRIVPVKKRKISRREIYLLRHLSFMFCIYIIGWTPLCLLPLVTYGKYVPKTIYFSVSVLSELCLLCVIIDLFFYNHGVRKYLINLLLRCAY